ncbi:hypothetical protein F2981_18705 (plasmid) [Sinorhizobium meliloti]|nr:hypothetical protein [Sinorhizobium meliloti]
MEEKGPTTGALSCDWIFGLITPATQGELDDLPRRRIRTRNSLFMAEYAVNREDALRLIVRDWLGSHGYLALTEDESELGKETAFR